MGFQDYIENHPYIKKYFDEVTAGEIMKPFLDCLERKRAQLKNVESENLDNLTDRVFYGCNLLLKLKDESSDLRLIDILSRQEIDNLKLIYLKPRYDFEWNFDGKVYPPIFFGLMKNLVLEYINQKINDPIQHYERILSSSSNLGLNVMESVWDIIEKYEDQTNSSIPIKLTYHNLCFSLNSMYERVPVFVSKYSIPRPKWQEESPDDKMILQQYSTLKDYIFSEVIPHNFDFHFKNSLHQSKLLCIKLKTGFRGEITTGHTIIGYISFWSPTVPIRPIIYHEQMMNEISKLVPDLKVEPDFSDWSEHIWNMLTWALPRVFDQKLREPELELQKYNDRQNLVPIQISKEDAENLRNIKRLFIEFRRIPLKDDTTKIWVPFLRQILRILPCNYIIKYKPILPQFNIEYDPGVLLNESNKIYDLTFRRENPEFSIKNYNDIWYDAFIKIKDWVSRILDLEFSVSPEFFMLEPRDLRFNTKMEDDDKDKLELWEIWILFRYFYESHGRYRYSSNQYHQKYGRMELNFLVGILSTVPYKYLELYGPRFPIDQILISYSEKLSYLDFFDMLIQDVSILNHSSESKDPIVYVEKDNRYAKGLLSIICMNIHLFLALLFQEELNANIKDIIKWADYDYFSKNTSTWCKIYSCTEKDEF